MNWFIKNCDSPKNKIFPKMAAVSVSHRRLFFAHCPWCSAFFHNFVDFYVIHHSPPSFFLKPFNCRPENGVMSDVGVVAVLAVAVVLAVFVAAAMASCALAKRPSALVADCCVFGCYP